LLTLDGVQQLRDMALPQLSALLGQQGIDLEIVQTRLDPLAGARPALFGHMSSGIPHPHAVGDGTVKLLLTGLRR
jgi:hypothetical protein